jgi:hypothetical protein
MSADHYPHAESELVATLGLARKRVRDVRAGTLVRGEDWNHIGGQVRYTDEGQKKLLSALHITPPPAAPSAPEPTDAKDLAPKKSVLLTPDDLPDDDSIPSVHIDGEASGGKTAALQLKPGDERELVCSKLCLNKAIVLATFGTLQVRVRVRDSSNITRGLKMKCRLIDADLWQLAQRLPRWKGKW